MLSASFHTDLRKPSPGDWTLPHTLQLGQGPSIICISYGLCRTFVKSDLCCPLTPQAGIDDTAKAAGLAAGHLESTVDAAKQQVWYLY
jgi:hypothetical protein